MCRSDLRIQAWKEKTIVDNVFQALQQDQGMQMMRLHFPNQEKKLIHLTKKKEAFHPCPFMSLPPCMETRGPYNWVYSNTRMKMDTHAHTIPKLH